MTLGIKGFGKRRNRVSRDTKRLPSPAWLRDEKRKSAVADQATLLFLDTYGSPYPKEADVDETISQGGFASHIRAHEYFVFPIPDAIPSTAAAPMMCAGLTTYSPLVRAGIGPGKKVAVVGVGGLGHFGILWAAALGAEVTAISHSPHKAADAAALGARHFIDTTQPEWARDHAFEFDMVLNTADATDRFDLAAYQSLCKVNGVFHHVGIPDAPLPAFKVNLFITNGSSMSASHIGNRHECLAMLQLAADRKLAPMIETLPVGEAGCAEAVDRVSRNKVRYRFTLTDFDAVFGKRA